MNIDPLTLHFSIFIIGLITVYDVWTLLKRGYQTTISWNLYAAAIRFPIIPLAIGVIVGHLFWPNRGGM